MRTAMLTLSCFLCDHQVMVRANFENLVLVAMGVYEEMIRHVRQEHSRLSKYAR